jgi:plasmanylethanolamine desaturase
VSLAGTYTKGHRVYEWSCIALAFTSASALAFNAVHAFQEGRTAWTPSAWLSLPLAFLFADAVSGLVHWGFDTFGDENTFLVGQLAIRTFREHHHDPEAMTKHDWVETNGHNIGLAIVLSALGAWYARAVAVDGVVVFFALSCFVVSVTSQIHKWAHLAASESLRMHVPRWVQRLQAMRIILPPQSHAVHHHAPHKSHYCIATGWLNRPVQILLVRIASMFC